MSPGPHLLALAAAIALASSAGAGALPTAAPSPTSDASLVTAHDRTLEQQAETFAENSVKYGQGFNPNNSRHRSYAKTAKDMLKAVFLAAHDGRDGSAKLTSGAILTDGQLQGVVRTALVVLSTQDIGRNGRTASGRWSLGAREDGTVGNTFRIDIDHQNLALLAWHFRSDKEAISFAVLHEMGHAIAYSYGNGMLGEEVANYYALAVGRELGIRMPTIAEVTRAAGYSIWSS